MNLMEVIGGVLALIGILSVFFVFTVFFPGGLMVIFIIFIVLGAVAGWYSGQNNQDKDKGNH